MPSFAVAIRRLAPLVLVVLLAGCAAKGPQAPVAGEAKAVFATFVANQAKTPSAPAFALSGSMSFSRGNRSGRLNYRLFGNTGHMARLDLTTTVGGAYASLFEEGGAFFAFVPSKNAVYRDADTRHGASKLGMPLPFTLGELAALARGRYGAIIPDHYAAAKKTADGYVYSFSGSDRISALTLDFAGNPRQVVGVGVEPWRIGFEDPEAEPGGAVPVARRLTLTTPGGASLIVRVKSLQARPAAYPSAALELPVPPNAVEHQLGAEDGEASLPDF